MGFFKSFLASLLAIFVSFFVLFFLFLALLAGLASTGSSDSQPFVRDNTILKLSISGGIPETASDDPFEQIFNPGGNAGSSMIGILENLEKAAADKRVAGVWLEMGPLGASWSTLYEVREALLKFKESGKFMYASTNDFGMNEQAYYLATVADSIFAPPVGMFEFDGFYLQPMFLKDMFDKLGIEAEVIRSGSFKSAGEMFTRNDLSAENREQYEAILSTSTDEFMTAVSSFTGLSRADLDNMLNNEPTLGTADAQNRGLINELLQPVEVEGRIKARLELEADAKLNTISGNRYYRVSKSSAGISTPSTSDKIAVIRASGTIMPQIVSGFGEESGTITVNNFKESLDKVLADKNVKALVIRIDSPGGAATTSDELQFLIKQAAEKMPVVASMSTTAASGGYYIAMGADTVMASPHTITGSIGVISMKYNVEELMNEKIGITFDEVLSHRNADWLSFTKPFTTEQANRFQDFNAATYERFLQIVSDNRGITRDQVHELAQGRVWTGRDAKENGLVDILGGYQDALNVAASMAGIENFNVVTYPVEKTFIERFASRTQNVAMTWLNPQTELQRLARKVLHLTGPGPGYPIARSHVEFRIF
jgi:protease IV